MADKGLNCAENIIHTLKSSDGYIFSKSVKLLPETEVTWVFLNNDYRDVRDKNGNLLYRIKECTDDFTYTITDSYGSKRKVQLWEKRVSTFNPKLAEKQTLEIKKQVEKGAVG